MCRARLFRPLHRGPDRILWYTFYHNMRGNQCQGYGSLPVDFESGASNNVRPMNIIFIVIDTLRAASLGCYGYARPTSPSLDRFSAEGVRFERAFAAGIPTTSAHTTMFTGMHPLSHNI